MNRENWLKFSLLVNLVLAIVIGILVSRPAKPRPSSPAADALNHSASSRADPAAGPPSPNEPMPVPTVATSYGDWRDWVGALRAAGVPNKIVAQTVLSDLDQRWQKRFEESMGDADTMTALQLEQETNEEAELRSALGPEGFKTWDQERQLKEANMGKIQLSASESDAIYDMKKKLQQRNWDLEEAMLNGEIDNTDFNDMQAKAYADFNQQMKTLLGDDRYAASQGVDEGAAAANLRKDLAKVNPTDSQFQDLLQAQQQYNQRLSALDPSSAAYAEQTKALNEARDQEYQRVLGTNSFDALQMEQDPSYTAMKKYESAWGINDTDVNYAYQTIQYYQQSVQNYQQQEKALEQQGQTVDWNAVNKNIQQFSQQTDQALRNYLGDRYDKIQRNGVFPFNANGPITGPEIHASPGH
jgi:hypothetical protein